MTGIHGAAGVIPGTLWVVILFIAGAIFVFMLFFADSGERAVTQAMMMGTVTAVIAATVLLIQFLDDPFRDGYGGLKPVAMERTLRILDAERRVVEGHRRPAVRRARQTTLVHASCRLCRTHNPGQAFGARSPGAASGGA